MNNLTYRTLNKSSRLEISTCSKKISSYTCEHIKNGGRRQHCQIAGIRGLDQRHIFSHQAAISKRFFHDAFGRTPDTATARVDLRRRLDHTVHFGGGGVGDDGGAAIHGPHVHDGHGAVLPLVANLLGGETVVMSTIILVLCAGVTVAILALTASAYKWLLSPF